tara:strand:+ start:298 stop:855 length:558 start_codon:yes stop_codon:yes gene_type:complete
LLNQFIAIFEALNVLFWQDPTAQTIGFIALFVGISGFLHREDQKLKYYLTAFTFLMAIHFFMLSLWTAALLALLGSARNYVSSVTNNVWVMSIFIVVAWIITIPNSSEWVQIIPVVGVSFGTWALFKEKGLRMRFFMSLGTLCWLSHNHLVGSIGGVIIEGLFLVVNARTMIKLFKEQQSQNPPL